MSREEALDTIKCFAKYSAYWKNIWNILQNTSDFSKFDNQIKNFKDNWELSFKLNREYL